MFEWKADVKMKKLVKRKRVREREGLRMVRSLFFERI